MIPLGIVKSVMLTVYQRVFHCIEVHLGIPKTVILNKCHIIRRHIIGGTLYINMRKQTDFQIIVLPEGSSTPKVSQK